MKIGIDLGGSHIAIGVIDPTGRMVEKVEKRLLKQEKKNIQNIIENYIIQNVKQMKKKYMITQIGIAIPGSADQTSILKAVNLGIENYPLGTILETELKLPVILRNDAKCAAIAEYKLGALKGYPRILFLTLGTGIGGAVLIHGELLETGPLPGCEFGHMIIQKDGIVCNCGKKGCFEKYASMKSFKNNLRQVLRVDEKTRGEELLAILRTRGEEPEIKRVVEEFIEYLSIGISNLVAIFEPEIIGIGGSFVYFQDVLLEKLENTVKEKYLWKGRESLRIIPAALENDAGIIGSVF